MNGGSNHFGGFVTACTISLLAGCSSIDPRPDLTVLASDHVNLPTVQDSGLLFVDVRLNGVGPYRLLVDTGTTGVVLCADTAKTSGLKPFEESHSATPEEKVQVSVARLERLDSGGLTLEGMSVEVMKVDDAALFRRAFGRFDGFMGFGAFRDVLLQVDFPGSQVSVTRLEGQPKSLQGGLPYSPGSNLCPYVLIDFLGRMVPAMIDTGSNFGIVVPDLGPDSSRVLYTEGDVSRGVAIGSTHLGSLRNAQIVGVLRSGPVSWSNPKVGLLKPGEKMGNIGAAALNTWTLVFDQQSRRIYFTGSSLSRSWPK